MRQVLLLLVLAVAAALGAELRWLGSLNTPYAEAHGVAADGSTAVGWAGVLSPHRAWLWIRDSGMTVIQPPAPDRDCEAWGISADGRVVVGCTRPDNTSNYRGFCWDRDTMIVPGTLGGDWGEAWAANRDGSIVVGWSERSQGNWAAFRWSEATGMEDLNAVFADLLSPGSVLRDAMAISPDGRFIAGRGYNAHTGVDEAYLLDTGSSAFSTENHRPAANSGAQLTSSPNPFRQSTTLSVSVPNCD